MVPPGLSICTITAFARELAKPVERLDAILIAADQALDLDAGDVVARRHKRLPGISTKPPPHDRDERPTTTAR